MRNRSKSIVSYYTHLLWLIVCTSATFFLLIILSLLLIHSITHSFVCSIFISSIQMYVWERRRDGRYSIKYFCISTGKHDRHGKKKVPKQNANQKSTHLHTYQMFRAKKSEVKKNDRKEHRKRSRQSQSEREKHMHLLSSFRLLLQFLGYCCTFINFKLPPSLFWWLLVAIDWVRLDYLLRSLIFFFFVCFSRFLLFCSSPLCVYLILNPFGSKLCAQF